MNIFIEGILVSGLLLSGEITSYKEVDLTEKKTLIQPAQQDIYKQQYRLDIYNFLKQQHSATDVLFQSFDFESDESIHKFVTAGLGFTDRAYAPDDLVLIQSDVIKDAKGNSQMRMEANEALQKMGKQFLADMNYKLVNVSAYRPYEYQLRIEQGGCPPELCARAGFSEHQSGLAIDFFSASTLDEWKQSEKLTDVFTWLNANAYKYGFHNSYQKGKEVDGYSTEPWHWRYLGVELATYLQQKNMTFAEYYNSIEKNKRKYNNHGNSN